MIKVRQYNHKNKNNNNIKVILKTTSAMLARGQKSLQLLNLLGRKNCAAISVI